MDIETSYIDLSDAPVKLQQEIQETLSEADYDLLFIRKIKCNLYKDIIQFQYTAFMYCKTFDWIQIHELIMNNDIGEAPLTHVRMNVRDVKELMRVSPDLFR